MAFDPNLAALNQFYQRELAPAPKARLLLHLVGTGEARHIEIVDEGKLSVWQYALHRLKLLFRPADYQIGQVQKFLQDRAIQVPPEIKEIIQKKVIHAKEPFVQKVWRSVFSPKEVATKGPPDYCALLNDFCDKLMGLEKAKPHEVKAFQESFDKFQTLAKRHKELAPYEEMARAALIRKNLENRPAIVPSGIGITDIAKQEGDGNCLLRSFAVAAGLEAANHSHFRKESADWLRAHWKADKLLQGVILTAITTNNVQEQKLYDENRPFLLLVSQGQVEGIDDVQKRGSIQRLKEVEARYKERFIPAELSDEAKIERYIALSEKETFFCDNPQIIALAHRYNVSIEVYNTHFQPSSAPKLTKSQISGCILDAPQGLIRLHYDSEGQHYNAIVQPLPSSVDEVTKKLGDLSL